LLCVGLILACLGANDTCSAATIITTSLNSSAPTTDLYVSGAHDDNYTDSTVNNTGATKSWMQQFKGVTDVQLEAITVKLAAGVSAATKGASVTLTLKSYSTMGSVSGATTIASIATTLPTDSISWSSQYLSFAFSGTAVQLNANTVYGYELTFVTPDTGAQLTMSYGTPIAGTLGGAYRNYNSGGSGTYFLGSEAIDTYIQAAAIPEPSSVSLAALALFGLVSLGRIAHIRSLK